MLVGCSSNLCALSIAVSPSSLLKWPLVRSWQSGGDGKGWSARVVVGAHTEESWIMWKINTFEALALAGRRGVGSVVKCLAFIFSLLLSPSLHVIVCAASASGCWCWSSALGLYLTHMQPSINTDTHTSSSQCWTLAAPLWPDQHPSCVLCHSHAGDTLLGGHSLYLIGCCCGFAIHLGIVALVMADKAEPSSTASSRLVAISASNSRIVAGNTFIAGCQISAPRWGELIGDGLKTIS